MDLASNRYRLRPSGSRRYLCMCISARRTYIASCKVQRRCMHAGAFEEPRVITQFVRSATGILTIEFNDPAYFSRSIRVTDRETEKRERSARARENRAVNVETIFSLTVYVPGVRAATVEISLAKVSTNACLLTCNRKAGEKKH